MTTIRRLTDSCVLVTTDDAVTMFDPGFHTFDAGEVDLETIGDVTRILITHAHPDHLKPDFVRWVIDRGSDVTVHANPAVTEALEPHGIEVVADLPAGTSAEDVSHEVIPTGAAPPNRSWTLEGHFTHPGDSYEPTVSAPVLALPLMAPWGSTTASVAFARRLSPAYVVPVHDFYLSASGRSWVATLAKNVLAGDGIELVPLDWGESFTA